MTKESTSILKYNKIKIINVFLVIYIYIYIYIYICNYESNVPSRLSPQ